MQESPVLVVIRVEREFCDQALVTMLKIADASYEIVRMQLNDFVFFG